MIRILHTIDTTGPGGAETVFLNLIKGLDLRKFEPIVAIKGHGWVCDELNKNGIKPLFIRSKGAFNFAYLGEIIRIIRRNKIDIVQSHLLGSNLYCSLAGLVCRVPVVSTFHGFVDINTKERFSTIKRMIINQGSAKIVFVSDGLKNFYVKQKGFSSTNSVTIYNGIDTSIFKPQRNDTIRRQLGLGPENILVGAVGNIRPSKGYEYFLEAAKLVLDRYPHFRFIVLGEGSGNLFDKVLKLRNELGLDGVFTFYGFHNDVSQALNNLDIFVLPSIAEGFSISTIEAMSCGLPVIATRSGGPQEIIRNFKNGILIDPCTSSQLAEAIILLHTNDGVKSSLMISAEDTARNLFSIKSLIQGYTDIYDALLLPAN
jgi:glycosyltransferase involved in cell wall biosynthesis